MARSRKRVSGEAGVGAVAPASATAVSCLAVGAAMVGDVRTVPGQWYEFSGDVAAYWHSRGVLWSQAQIDALWSSEGRILTPDGVGTQYKAHAMGRGVRVLQLAHYDPGASVYRYHSAANTVPGVVSAFARVGQSNPHTQLRQWDMTANNATVRVLAWTADVVHCHMDYTTLEEIGGLPLGPRAAITYHGSIEAIRPRITFPEADERMASIVFGARPYHVARFGAEWLPIPMPCKDYAKLAKGHTRGAVYRVAHSPTRTEIKGTEAFRWAVDALKAEGVAIEAVLIQDMPHGEALRLKATCDATFDAFWLGLQGSGLEGAAMGQAVIAGTTDAPYGAVGIPYPWTVANDPHDLLAVLRRLATDPDYHATESARVGAYVRTYHDYPVVGAMYRDILTEAARGTTDPR
jgi:hypothetical protein